MDCTLDQYCKRQQRPSSPDPRCGPAQLGYRYLEVEVLLQGPGATAGCNHFTVRGISFTRGRRAITFYPLRAFWPDYLGDQATMPIHHSCSPLLRWYSIRQKSESSCEHICSSLPTSSLLSSFRGPAHQTTANNLFMQSISLWPWSLS